MNKLKTAFKAVKADPDEDDEDCFVDINKLVA